MWIECVRSTVKEQAEKRAIVVINGTRPGCIRDAGRVRWQDEEIRVAFHLSSERVSCGILAYRYGFFKATFSPRLQFACGGKRDALDFNTDPLKGRRRQSVFRTKWLPSRHWGK